MDETSFMTLDNGFQMMVSIETVLENLKSGNQQHSMLDVKGKRGVVEQVFLMVKGQGIKIIRGGLLFGLEKLMKVYFVMQMAYPPECFHVPGINDGVHVTCCP